MRFHLTKSSTALLVFAAPPTTATSGTRLCQLCLTCSSVAVTAWKMSTRRVEIGSQETEVTSVMSTQFMEDVSFPEKR